MQQLSQQVSIPAPPVEECPTPTTHKDIKFWRKSAFDRWLDLPNTVTKFESESVIERGLISWLEQENGNLIDAEECTTIKVTLCCGFSKLVTKGWAPHSWGLLGASGCWKKKVHVKLEGNVLDSGHISKKRKWNDGNKKHGKHTKIKSDDPVSTKPANEKTTDKISQQSSPTHADSDLGGGNNSAFPSPALTLNDLEFPVAEVYYSSEDALQATGVKIPCFTSSKLPVSANNILEGDITPDSTEAPSAATDTKTKKRKNLCTIRWVKHNASSGGAADFKKYYDTLTMETHKLYDDEAAALVSNGQWKMNSTTVILVPQVQ
ncbi:hypothetical protein HD554DRAFT_2040415 [Boletus coccyginus]|nr:hypothetical protein HD554DRAFT_2040415 [Boletus coccyginus]